MKALRGILAISQPIKQGVVQNWDDLEVNSSRNFFLIFLFYKIMVINPFRQSGSIFGLENFKPFLQIYQPYSHILHPLQVDIPVLLTHPPSSTGRYTSLTHTSSILYRQIYQPYSHILHPLQVVIPALLTHPLSSTGRYTSSTHTSSILYRQIYQSSIFYRKIYYYQSSILYRQIYLSSILYRQIYQSSIIFDGKKKKNLTSKTQIFILFNTFYPKIYLCFHKKNFPHNSANKTKITEKQYNFQMGG